MSDAPKDHRRQDILLYQQGYLDEAERAELEAHMRDCASCQATMEKVARFLPALQQALTPKLRSSAELLAAVKAQMAAAESEKRARFTIGPLAWLGLAVAAAGVAFIVLQPPPRGSQPDVLNTPRPGMVYAPRPPGWDQDGDAGPDGGMGDAGESLRSPQ
jgi:predicted anti-sigma-YlaC factor YlaD